MPGADLIALAAATLIGVEAAVRLRLFAPLAAMRQAAATARAANAVAQTDEAREAAARQAAGALAGATFGFAARFVGVLLTGGIALALGALGLGLDPAAAGAAAASLPGLALSTVIALLFARLRTMRPGAPA